jgi:hypothetical protein
MPIPEDAPREWSAWESIGIDSIQRKKVRRQWWVTSCGFAATGNNFWQAVERALDSTGRSVPQGFKNA